MWCDCFVFATLTRMDRKPKFSVTLRMNPTELSDVDVTAHMEQRSRSQMLRLLIVEALTARAQKAKP